MAGVAAHDFFPLFLRDLVFAEVKRLGDRDLVAWFRLSAPLSDPMVNEPGRMRMNSIVTPPPRSTVSFLSGTGTAATLSRKPAMRPSLGMKSPTRPTVFRAEFVLGGERLFQPGDDRYAGQPGATGERTVPDAGDAAGDRHAGQAGAAVERPVPDAGDAVAGIVTLVRLAQPRERSDPMPVTQMGIVTRSGWCNLERSVSDAGDLVPMVSLRLCPPDIGRAFSGHVERTPSAAAVARIGASPLYVSPVRPVDRSLPDAGHGGLGCTLVSPLQPANALSQMPVTLSGIVTLVRRVQPENASTPMLVTLAGIVTVVRLVQDWNAYSRMLVTLLGIVTQDIWVQDSNAELPMLVTGLPVSGGIFAGITTAPIAMPGSR